MSHVGRGAVVNVPALDARFGSGSALFEYHETVPELGAMGSVLFEYQSFGCPSVRCAVLSEYQGLLCPEVLGAALFEYQMLLCPGGATLLEPQTFGCGMLPCDGGVASVPAGAGAVPAFTVGAGFAGAACWPSARPARTRAAVESATISTERLRRATRFAVARSVPDPGAEPLTPARSARKRASSRRRAGNSSRCAAPRASRSEAR